MKLKFLIIFILLLLPIVSAVDVDMKSNFSQGETFIAKVSGNFFETISKEDLVFKREHVELPMIPLVQKIDGDFYIYAQTYGKQSGNYSLTIENLKYYKINEIIEEDKIIPFTITENFADFIIEPGFVSTGSDFSIELQNIVDNEITVFSKVKNESQVSGGFFESLFGGGNGGEILNPIILKSGEKKSINFEISEFKKGLNYLEVNTEEVLYEIPIFVFDQNTKEKEIPSSELDFELSMLNISFSTNSDITRIIYLFNRGETTIENISLSFSDDLKPYVRILKNETFDIEENSSEKIELIFTSDDEEKIIEGQIKALSGDLFSNIAITLNFLPGFVPTTGEGKVSSCSELNGTICVEGEICEGDLKSASDGNCCIGTCKEEVERSQTGKIVGWVLIVSILGYFIWFYLKKYKKVGNVFNILKLANKKKK